MAPKRILIVKPSSLGDIAHALPVADSLKRTWPEARVAWLANAHYRPILEACPDVDRVHVVHRDAWRGPLGPARGIGPLARLVAELRRERFDLALDLQGLLRSAFYTRVTGAPARFGECEAREFAAFGYTHRVPTSPKGSHATDRYLAVARAAGADTTGAEAHLVPKAEAAAWFAGELAGRFGAGAGGPVVTLACGSRWATKLWPADHYAELARRLAKDLGARPVLIGSGEFSATAATIEARAGVEVLRIEREIDLGELVAVVAASDVVVGSDSGPQHVAHAAGVSTVTLYGPTTPALTAPRGERAKLFEGECERAPCHERECEDVRCMASIDPRRVAEAVGDLVERRKAR